MSAPDPEFCGWHRSVHLSLTLKMNRPDEMPLSGTQTWGHVEHKHHTSVDGAASSGDLGKEQRHYFANKGPSSQGYGFSCGHVWM